MITPSFSLTATERILPRMALDFTTATLDPRVTFTRTGDTATVTNSSGVIVAINANLPRFDFDSTTLTCKGLLIEESRTNLLLNSLLNGTSLSTQLVTTTAAAHTLSFYGTGQIVLTGTSSATVVGTGAYPTQTKLTFTPTVGVLTLTVTGTVQYAQLEVGAFATSFIPTDATTKTRNVDSALMTGTNFSSWFNASEGAFQMQSYISPTAGDINYFFASDGSINNCIYFDHSSGTVRNVIFSGGAPITISTGTIGAVGSALNIVTAYKLNSFAAAKNAGTVGTAGAGAVPISMNQLSLGSALGIVNFINTSIAKVMFYPQRIINNEVQAFSK
jgi:hypothetical protein